MLKVTRTQKEVFVTTDGKEFDDENEAIKHAVELKIEELADIWGRDSQDQTHNVSGFIICYGSEIRDLLNDLLEQR